MKQRIFLIIFAIVITCIFCSFASAADILPNGVGSKIKQVSIGVSPSGSTDDVIAVSQNIGFRILTAIRLVVSGFALIYLVLVGVYMVVFSETEDRIKTQRKQIIYALIGFLFLNIPGIVYQLFFGDISGAPNNSIKDVGGVTTGGLWNMEYLNGSRGIITMLTSFFEVFIFGVAILMFTWGFFRLILSGGDEEIQKKSKQKLVYGVLGLMFLGFVRVWGNIIEKGDFYGEFSTVGSKILGLALYFAAPVVIFFLIMGSYYYIASAGDEERTKKGKAIFINTLIASLILLGAYSFLSDLVSFTL